MRSSILVLEDWICVFIGLSLRQVCCGFICGEDGAGEGGGGAHDMYALWYAGRLVDRMDIEEEGEGLTSPGVAIVRPLERPRCRGRLLCLAEQIVRRCVAGFGDNSWENSVFEGSVCVVEKRGGMNEFQAGGD